MEKKKDMENPTVTKKPVTKKVSPVTMKLLIDTKKERVLFAEAGKDCVDFLFYILSLPVATVLRLLKAHEMEGSLPNLYKSLENLNETYMQPNQKKDTFLNPMLPVTGDSAPLLALDKTPNQKQFYICSRCNRCISDGSGASCPNCHVVMATAVSYAEPPRVEVGPGDGGLVKGVVTYMVMNDLVVQPMSAISSLTLLSKFNVKDVGALEEKVVDFGVDEAIRLLKSSLESKNVLTEVFCESKK